MADDKSVAAGKRDTFTWRLNVLSSFGASAPAAPAADAGKAELK
jgi:hypothetical protein